MCGLVSLPLPWLTYKVSLPNGSPVSSGFSLFQGLAFGETGLNGSLTLIAEFPYWLLVVAAIAASALQLLRISPHFDVSPVVETLVAILAATGIVAVAIVGGEHTMPGIGWLFGLAAAILPLVCTFSARGPRNNPL